MVGGRAGGGGGGGGGNPAAMEGVTTATANAGCVVRAWVWFVVFCVVSGGRGLVAGGRLS